MKLAQETKEFYETLTLGACEVKDSELLYDFLEQSRLKPVTFESCFAKKRKETIIESHIPAEMPVRLNKEIMVSNILEKGFSFKDICLLTRESLESFILLKDFLEGIDMKFPVYSKSEHHVKIVGDYIKSSLDYPIFASLFSLSAPSKDFIVTSFSELTRIFTQSKYKISDFLTYIPFEEKDFQVKGNATFVNFGTVNMVCIDNPTQEDFDLFLGLKRTKNIFIKYQNPTLTNIPLEDKEEIKEESDVKEEEKTKKTKVKKETIKVESRLITFIYGNPPATSFKGELKEKYLETFYSFSKNN